MERTASDTLQGDLLEGASEISGFLWGDSGKAKQRRVYNLHEQGALPLFKVGAILCGRKSTLLAWIEEQERRAVKREAA